MRRIALIAIILLSCTVSLKAQRRSGERIYARNQKAVVRIHTELANRAPHSHGSGVILKDRGWIVTNYHVLGSASTIYAEHNGKYLKLDSVLTIVPEKDIMILRFSGFADPAENKTIPRLKVGKSANEPIGSRVYAIGSPFGLENTISEGMLSGKRKWEDKQTNYLQVSAPISSGSSGGGIFNDKGELIGISTSVLTGKTAQNLNFALAIEEVMEAGNQALSTKMETEEEKFQNLVRSAYSAQTSGDNERAAKLFSQALKAPGKKDRAHLLFCLGNSLQNLGKNEEARAAYTQSLDLKDNWDTMIALAWTYVISADYSTAIALYELALEQRPNSSDVFSLLATAKYLSGKPSDAIKLCKQALELDQRNYNAYFILGTIAEDAKEDQKALEFYDLALKYHPLMAECYVQISKIYLRANMPDKAAGAQQKAYQINPSLRGNR